MRRLYEKHIINDLKNKMVFIGGPRQVGKTTITEHLIKHSFTDGAIFNWDSEADRTAILKYKWPEASQLIVFDELHKYPKWKQWIKGIYDTKTNNQQYIVTGSAKLNVYKKGGDSLLGRYHYWRIHPLSLDEIPNNVDIQDAYQRLMTVGGFPEPFLSNNQRSARRWRRERFERILREDVQDLSNIRQLQLLKILADELRNRVGSMTNNANIAADIQVSANTIKQWLALLHEMYVTFPIYPMTKNVPRSILKPAKIFFYDNADVLNGEGARLENLVATHLLKRLHYLEDFEGYECSLHYIRDKDGREVDFVTVIDGKITDLIEVKTKDNDISSALKYYAEKLNPIRATQLVGNLKRPYDKHGIKVTTPIEFFKRPIW